MLGIAGFVLSTIFAVIILHTERPLAALGRAAQSLWNWMTCGWNRMTHEHRPSVTGLDKRLLTQRDTIRAALARKWQQAVLLTTGRPGFDFGCLQAEARPADYAAENLDSSWGKADTDRRVLSLAGNAPRCFGPVSVSAVYRGWLFHASGLEVAAVLGDAHAAGIVECDIGPGEAPYPPSAGCHRQQPHWLLAGQCEVEFGRVVTHWGGDADFGSPREHVCADGRCPGQRSSGSTV